MKTTRLLMLVLIALLLVNPQGGQLQLVQKPEPQPVQATQISAKKAPKVVDMRVRILSEYLTKHNSPMKDSAPDFIEAADKYGVDWKLVPAITGVESTFGQNIPGGLNTSYTSYNAWGWGVYGTNVIRFKSWREGIFTVTEGLKTRYIDRGLTNPFAINKVYAASPTWGAKVSFFLNDLDKFTQTYQIENQPKEPEVLIPIKDSDIFPANQAANTFSDNPVSVNLVKAKSTAKVELNSAYSVSQVIH